MVACSVGPFPLAEFFNRFMPVHQELLTITLQETIISLEETSIDEADNISLRVETLVSCAAVRSMLYDTSEHVYISSYLRWKSLDYAPR